MRTLFDKRGRIAALTHEGHPQGEGQDAPSRKTSSFTLPQNTTGPQG